MTTYGPWLTAPDRVVRFGYLGDFGVSDTSSYRTSTSTSSQAFAAGETGFGTVITNTDTNEPFAGHSYDGTTWTFQRANAGVVIHPGVDDSYIPSPPPPRAYWDWELPGVGTVVGDLTVIVTPIGYTGGATGTQFNYGIFDFGGPPAAVIEGTFNYGDTTPQSVTRIAVDIGVLGSHSYAAGCNVWDTLQVSGAPSVAVEAGFVQVATAVVATIRPPRYRAAYDVLPPLRQYPRNDTLGGAPRQGKANSSTSVQSSARQGWKNVYR